MRIAAISTHPNHKRSSPEDPVKTLLFLEKGAGAGCADVSHPLFGLLTQIATRCIANIAVAFVSNSVPGAEAVSLVFEWHCRLLLLPLY